jgi:tRNA(Ile)-lysidine synthase
MKLGLQRCVLRTIHHHGMAVPGDLVGIGVSGGADSVALLRLLAELQPHLGIRLNVLHFHHQLRGAEADEDERFVAALARGLGFDFLADRADVASEARRNGWNLEDAARRLRYRFFASAAAAHGIQRVAVAHTADDQAETVLAHLLRGTGPTGLAGIYPVVGLIIRPLLEVRRAMLRDYVSRLGQPWREDSSNRDRARLRAHIRHDLLPLLERDFERAVVVRLARLASLEREEQEFWRALEQERFTALVAREKSGEISISIENLLSPMPSLGEPHPARKFLGAPAAALSKRLVRQIYSELRGSRKELTSRHVEDVLHLTINAQSGARVEVPGIRVERVFDRLVFSRALPESRGGKSRGKNSSGCNFEYSIPAPAASKVAYVVVPEIRRRINLKVVDWPLVSRETTLGEATLDFDRVCWPLVVRNWRPGDAYRPYRRRQVRKLKQMFLELRIPARDRAFRPVLTSGGTLIWASGCPVADEVAPRAGTRAAVIIAEEAI